MAAGWRSKTWIWFALGTCALAGLYMFVPPFKGVGPVMNAVGFCGFAAIVVAREATGDGPE